MSDDDANRVLEVEAARLGEIIDALEVKAREGDVQAIDRLVKLAKERARLARQIQPPPAPPQPEKPPQKLTEKQRRFVEAYMGAAAGNASEAARVAGYKGRAGWAADDVMSNEKVRAAIEERQRGDPLVATREERQRFWTSIMRGEPQVQLIGERPATTVPAMRERILAAQHLAKASGDFVERIKHEGSIGHEVIVVELPDNARADR